MYVQTQKIALIEIDAVYLYYLSIFRTSHDDFNINETSSYVDLAPLTLRCKTKYGLATAENYRTPTLLLKE